MTISLTNSDALIVVDIQNDFCAGGALEVPGADEIVETVNQIADEFRNVIITQDWHPEEHVSFASTHERQPFDKIEIGYGTQVLWPVHCVQGTEGAELHERLDIPHAQLVIRKGFNVGIDSYSGFLEADRKTPTGLSGYLTERGIKRVFIVGLATDFCVAWTALDALRNRFQTYVVEDATRAIDLNGSLERAWADIEAHGGIRIQADDLRAPF